HPGCAEHRAGKRPQGTGSEAGSAGHLCGRSRRGQRAKGLGPPGCAHLVQEQVRPRLADLALPDRRVLEHHPRGRPVAVHGDPLSMSVYSYAQRGAGRFGELGEVTELTEAAPAIFPQTPGSLDWLLGPALQELPQSGAAFRVAVFGAEGAKGRPVMVFLPGGGFVSGAGTVRWYDAQNCAEKQNCVVVMVNYRSGLLAHRQQVGGGNLPVEELLLALKWV